MGREKDSCKRKHSHHSRHDSTEDSSQSDSSTDYSSESSSSDSESSVEVVKKKRRSSSEHHKGRKKVRSESKKKTKHSRIKTKKKAKHSGKKPKIVEISEDDYFLKSAEFRTWLSKDRGVYFSDLISEESRKLFRKFVVKWNKGLLGKRYYEGIQSAAVAHDTQSQYKWKFAAGMDSGELKSVRDSVSRWSAQGSEVRLAAGPSQPGPSTSGVIGPTIGPNIGPVRGGLLESPHEREERREEKRSRVKRERKAHRKQQEVVLDELLPKATGREAKIEKKRARAEERRDREYSPDTNDPYTTGPSTSIQARIRSMQQKRERKASSAVQKISDYKAKEKARMDAILEMAKANKKEGAMW